MSRQKIGESLIRLEMQQQQPHETVQCYPASPKCKTHTNQPDAMPLLCDRELMRSVPTVMCIKYPGLEAYCGFCPQRKMQCSGGIYICFTGMLAIALNRTGPYSKAVPRLRECCGQAETEVVSYSRNKIHQTWERPYSEALYNVFLFVP